MAPVGVIGVLRGDAAAGAAIMARTCESDADCPEGSRCDTLRAAEEGSEPLRLCNAE